DPAKYQSNIPITLIDVGERKAHACLIACLLQLRISTRSGWCKFLVPMKAGSSRTITLRIWISGALALLLWIACAVCYFGYMVPGIAIGDMIGLPGREADVALAQDRATHWLIACL